jgi:hypothetical protein
MNQLITQLVLFSGFTTLFLFCKSERNCRELTGRWTNKEGQEISFGPDGKALWLIKFGSQFDTFAIQYQYDCKATMPKLDLTNFQSGPLKGKTLYGIIEWSNDSVFRFSAEPGMSEDARPPKFNPEQTQRFYKE